jgi:hypothetical protein
MNVFELKSAMLANYARLVAMAPYGQQSYHHPIYRLTNKHSK